MVEGAQATAGATILANASGAPNVLWSDPFATAQGAAATLASATSIDPSMRDAYIQQWNFTVQKRLPWNFLADVGYVGSKGTRLSIAFDEGALALNRPIELVDPRTPGLAGIDARRPNQAFPRAVPAVKSIGNSNYHSLQTKLERRMASGLTFLTAYTWAKSLSGPHDQGGLIGNGSFIGSPQDYYNLENEHLSPASICVTGSCRRCSTSYPLSVPARSHVTLRAGGSSQPSSPHKPDFPPASWMAATRPGQVRALVPTLLRVRPPTWLEISVRGSAGSTRMPSRSPNGKIRNLRSHRRDHSARTDQRRFFHRQVLPFRERCRLELRSEFFNLFRHFNPEPGSVDRGVRSRTFGAVGGGVQGVATRIIQLGAKFYF